MRSSASPCEVCIAGLRSQVAFHNAAYGILVCKRSMMMAPLCQVEMAPCPPSGHALEAASGCPHTTPSELWEALGPYRSWTAGQKADTLRYACLADPHAV